MLSAYPAESAEFFLRHVYGIIRANSFFHAAWRQVMPINNESYKQPSVL
jgi:hypothetical protein